MLDSNLVDRWPLLVAALLCCAAGARADEPAPADAERIRLLERRLEQLEAESRARHAQEPVVAPPAVVSAAIAPPADPRRVPVSAFWRDGFNLESADKANRLHVGGIVQADGRYFPGNTAAGPVDAFVLRSARIELEGTLGRYVNFRLLPDFANGTLQLMEGYAEIAFASWLRLRVGKYKPPFGLERLQYEANTIFVERGYPTSLSPNRDIGAMLAGEALDATVVWSVGVFNGSGDNSTADAELDDDKELIARLFAHPFRKTRFAFLRDLGIGGAASFGQARGTLAKGIVTTAALPSDKTDGQVVFFRYASTAASTDDDTAYAAGRRYRAAAQGYYYFWRLGVLGEYVWNQQAVRLGPIPAPVAVAREAWQVYASFLLTNDKASFGGVKPASPVEFARGGGAGAWEIALRYSNLSVDGAVFDNKFADITKSARSATSYTAGLNWYLNANAKVQLDFVRTDFSGGAAAGANRPSENAVLGRLQYSL